MATKSTANTYVAFMRAINVAGHGVVKMDALCAAFSAVGCRNVKSLIQSGNIIFDAPACDEAHLLIKLQTALRALLGQEPVILVRTLDEIAALAALNPFVEFKSDPDSKFYTAFLAGRPKLKPPFPLVLPKEGLEVVAIKGREVFIVSRRNLKGIYGFPNAFIEKEFGVAATSRNWNTIVKIAALAQSEYGG